MSSAWTTAILWLAHTAVGGGLLLLLTVFLMRRTSQPALRQRLGELGLLAAMLVAILSLAPSWLVFSWKPAATTPSASQPSRAAKVVDLVPPPAHAIPQEDEADPVVVTSELPDKRTPESKETLQDAATTASRWLLIGYLVAAACLFARWLSGFAALERLLRESGPVPAPIADVLTQVSSRRPRLLMSQRLRAPICCGLFRPTIVLPAALCEAANSQRLRWVFAHELTHLDRRDAWSCFLFGLGQTLFFYLPWFWWLRRQVRLCQEYVADAVAIRSTASLDESSAPGYAEFLLSLTSLPEVPLGATGVTGSSSDLFRRVRMLLQNPLHVERRCPRSRALLAGGVLLTLAVLLAGIGLRLEAAPPSEQTSQSKTVRIFVEVEGSKPRVVTVPGTKVRKFKGIRVGANDAQPDLEPFRKLMKKLQDNPSLYPTDFAKYLKKAFENMNR